MNRFMASVVVLGMLSNCLAHAQDRQRPGKQKAGSAAADLAAVSIGHAVRVLEWKEVDGKPAAVIRNVVVGTVKNVSKHRYVGDCTITLSEGALRDDGTIAANPRVLKTTVLHTLAPGMSHSMRADVKDDYWDSKTIYILSIRPLDTNANNNKFTRTFERPPEHKRSAN